MKPSVPFLFCVFLAACGTNATPTAPVSNADIAAVEVTLTSVIRLANVCLNATVGPCVKGTAIRPVLIADIGKAYAEFQQVQTDNKAGLPVTLTALNLVMNTLSAETPTNGTSAITPSK